MRFRQWLLEQRLLEQKATIFVDLDNTLIDRTKDDICPRPYMDDFLNELRKLAPICILTYGPTEHQAKIAQKLGITAPVIGRDQYDHVKTLGNPILIDNDATSNEHTQRKLAALGVGTDRLIKVRPWFCGQEDHELQRALEHVKKLFAQNEWVEKNPQPVPKTQPFKTYQKAENMAEERKDKFAKALKAAADGFESIVNIKTEKSFKDKTQKRGKPPEKVFDVLRGAIFVDNKGQIDKAVENVKSHFLVKKVEHKVNPREEEYGYYGAVHIDVIVDGMVCEVQVMTKKLWDAKFKTDKIYHKYRSGDPPPEALKKSRQMFRTANND